MRNNVSRQEDYAQRLYLNVDLFLEAEGNSPELMRETLWRLIDINREITRIQKRSGLMIVGAALVFELLNRGFIGEASFGGSNCLNLSS